MLSGQKPLYIYRYTTENFSIAKQITICDFNKKVLTWVPGQIAVSVTVPGIQTTIFIFITIWSVIKCIPKYKMLAANNWFHIDKWWTQLCYYKKREKEQMLIPPAVDIIEWPFFVHYL